jgi:hypothetical protein
MSCFILNIKEETKFYDGSLRTSYAITGIIWFLFAFRLPAVFPDVMSSLFGLSTIFGYFSDFEFSDSQ